MRPSNLGSKQATMGRVVRYATCGFSAREAELLADALTSPGHRANAPELNGFRFVPAGGWLACGAARGAEAAAGAAGVDDARGGSRRVDAVFYLTSAARMARLYPQTYLRGLSVTDRSKAPIQVHINRANWERLPPQSEYRSLDAYRVHLLQHEGLHVVGYGHAACPRAGARAPVMMQPSKPRGGCRPWDAL
jgi:hypothetical protein